MSRVGTGNWTAARIQLCQNESKNRGLSKCLATQYILVGPLSLQSYIKWSSAAVNSAGCPRLTYFGESVLHS